MPQLRNGLRGCDQPEPNKEEARSKKATVRIARKRTSGKSSTLTDSRNKDKGVVVVRHGGGEIAGRNAYAAPSETTSLKKAGDNSRVGVV